MDSEKNLPPISRLVRCPYCDLMIREDRLQKHIKKAHSSPARQQHRQLVVPGSQLLMWQGPIHKTVFIKTRLNLSELKLQAQQLARELGPDNSRVKMLRRKIEDIEKGTVKR